MANSYDPFFDWPDRHCRAAWNARWREELVLELAELSSETLLAARRKRLLLEWKWKLQAAVKQLDRSSDMLAETLQWILEIAEGEVI